MASFFSTLEPPKFQIKSRNEKEICLIQDRDFSDQIDVVPPLPPPPLFNQCPRNILNVKPVALAHKSRARLFFFATLNDIKCETSCLGSQVKSRPVLLLHFKWDESKVNDEWFANEEAVRKSVGLQLETPVQIIETRKIKCGICFEEFPSDKIGDAACGHKYCFSCWQGYIGAAINDGPGSLNLRCPDPSCSVLITQDIINKLAKDEDKEKYARYVLRSYVEYNKKTKWCPSPGCEYAVEFMGNNNYDVFCACSFAFCWNCVEEAHRPVDCTTVAKWILKNCAESENMNCSYRGIC